MIYEIPNNFIQQEHKHLPAYLVGYTHFFYANTDELLTDADFDDWEIGLFNKDGVEVENFGTPTKDIISGSDYRFYFYFTISASVSGEHYLAVYNGVTEEVKFQGNLVNIITVDEVEEYTLFQWKNSTNRDNFNYEILDVYNSVFLLTNDISSGGKFEYEKKGYREQSTGRYREQKSQRRKFITLETYLFDTEANDAMGSLSDHDDILINGEAVTVKEGHDHEDNRDFNLTKGTISFYIDSYSTTNLNG